MSDTLGYRFHPAPDDRALGHPGLDFNLYGRPTEAHFDPEHAEITAVQPDGGAGRLVIGHGWPGPPRLRVCAGPVSLRDRRAHAVEAFSLGGDLTVDVQATYTACRLTSAAPVFRLTRIPGIDREDVESMLVEEFEALLARRSARWVDDPTEYHHRLAVVQPTLLYAVALSAIAARLGHIPFDRRPQQYHLTGTAIREEIQRLQATHGWPSPLPALEDVL